MDWKRFNQLNIEKKKTTNIYIYMSWIQVIHSVILSNVTPLIIFNTMTILTNPPLDYIIFIYSPCLQNFKVIKYQ